MLIKFNDNFVITYTKGAYQNITQNSKKNCKILKITSEWQYKEILNVISDLEPNIFPNLLFFIIEVENFELYTNQNSGNIINLQIFLSKFGKKRPLLIQLTSKDQSTTRFYFKRGDSDGFLEIDQQTTNKENFHDFPTFFTLLKNREFDEKLENLVIEKLTSTRDSSIIIKLLRTLNLSEEFLRKLFFACIAKGSKNDFISILDISFEDGLKLSTDEVQKSIVKISQLISCEDDSIQSILHKAIENSNEDLVNFLITNCKPMMLEINYESAVEISTAAFSSNQINTLCSLLSCDFPFPKGFDPNSVTDEQLRKIINERNDFHNSIATDNRDNLEIFIKNNPHLKFVYNTANDSALYTAIDSKKFKVLHFLGSFGFRAKEYDSLKEFINDKDMLDESNAAARLQREQNIIRARFNSNRPIMLVLTRSSIHNKNLSKEKELEYWQKIEKWFNDIYKTKIGSKLLDACSQCKDVKIIFDFECEEVNRIDPFAENSSGLAYPKMKWILIGAQFQNSKGESREQRIKGVIAHEMCHYVLGLVYENKENPYYEGDDEKAQLFEKIVVAFKKWKYGDFESEVDDECGGQLAMVYQGYKPKDHHPELVVIAPQIQAEFANDEAKITFLGQKYRHLFDYVDQFVIPDIEKFNLKQRESVRGLNKSCELFQEIQKLSNYEFLNPKDLNDLFSNQYVIVTTNIPKLFLLNILKHLQKEKQYLLDTKYIFTSLKILKNLQIFSELKKVIFKFQNLHVFVNCIGELESNLKELIINNTSKFIFIVPNENQRAKLTLTIYQNSLVQFQTSTSINYSWMDLTKETQKLLLQTKVNFQGSSEFSIFDLISNINDTQINEDSIVEQGEELIDDQVLNLLLENSEIMINNVFENEVCNKNFEILYQPRKFKKVQAGDVPVIKEDKLIKDVQNKAFVLISDNAGTGKSWVLANITNMLRTAYPKKWIIFVDLKQIIKTLKLQTPMQNFSSFIIENVLKVKIIFEAKLFTRLYENGKVCIIFDGFDEIAPDCTESALELINKFDKNDGNQLWIATRDYFEENLKEKLKINAVYKLEQFTKQESIDMLASSWMLHDLEKENNFHSEHILSKEHIRSSENFLRYQEIAQKVSKEILGAESQSIGIPQLLKMIADTFKDKKYQIFQITVPKVYSEFTQMQNIRWSREKGELRKEASTKQDYVLNYREVHQLFGMKSLFPNSSRFGHLDINDNDWSDEEIIACGLLNKKGDNFYFLHETFREYYAADFIVGILVKGELTSDVFEYFLTFLTIQKFGVVRMFLNELLFQNEAYLKVIHRKMKRIAAKFLDNIYQQNNLSRIFEENLENLGIFLIKILKHGKYEDVKIILENNKGMTKCIVKHPKLFQEFQDYMLNLEINNLRNFIVQQRIFHKLVGSTLDNEVIENFILDVESKTGSSFIAETLKIKNEFGENIISCAFQTSHLDTNKFQHRMKILKNFLKNFEIIELVEEYNTKGQTILHELAYSDDKEQLKYLWKELENVFESEDSPQRFKELLSKKSLRQKSTILHFSAYCKNIEFHKMLWKLLLDTFKNCELLKELIFAIDKDRDNFIHDLIVKSKSHIIEFVFLIIKQNLSDSEFQEILKSKGTNRKNLLQRAAVNSKELETHQFLWKAFNNSCESHGSFMKFLGEADQYGLNFLSDAARHTTNEILEFIIEELNMIASYDEVRKLLRNVTMYKEHIFHLAAENKSLELHKTLWGIFQKYFESSEILEIVKYNNTFDESFLLKAIDESSNDVIEFSWAQITKVIKNCDFISLEQNENFKQCDDIIKNCLQHGDIKENDREVLKFKWIESNITNSSKLFHNNFLCSEKSLTDKNYQNILPFTSDTNIENHKMLWKHLLETHKDREDLKNIILNKDKDGDNFVHNLVISNKADVIEYTFKVINENLNDTQYHEISSSKGYYERNLLQNAIRHSKDLNVHIFLWNHFRESYNTDQGFTEFLSKKDNINRNIFNLAASFTSSEILEFMEEKLEEIASRDQIRKLICNLNIYKKNLLQSAAQLNKSLKLHESLWKFIHKYFDSYEIVEFIKYVDTDEKSFLSYAVEKNTNEVIEFSWTQIIEVLKNNDLIGEENEYLKQCNNIIKNVLKSYNITKGEEEILKLNWIKNKSCNATKLFESYLNMIDEKNLSMKTFTELKAFATNYKMEHHEILWNHIIKNFENCSKLNKLLSETNNDDNNYIHLLVRFNKSDIIELTINMMKQNLSDTQFQEIMKSKGHEKRNLLGKAALNSKEIKTYRLLWKTLQGLCESNDEFLKILSETNQFGSNALESAAFSTISEIFEFIDDELEKIASKDQIKELLRNKNFDEQNILEATAECNDSLDSHKILWNILPRYFNSFEILEFINHRDKDNFHLLHIAVFYNTKEIIEFTWERIKEYLIKREDQVIYLNEKSRKGQNLYQLSLERTEKDPQVTLWVDNIMEEYQLSFLE